MAFIPIDQMAELKTDMEALKTTDAAHADIFNERLRLLLENDNHLNKDKEPVIAESTEDMYLNGKKKFVNFFDSVRGVLLTGFTSVPAAAITISDTVLTALEKLQAQVNEKLSKTAVVNNFTTTESGYAADARAVKTLQDTKANLASPAFTGIPTVPTAAKGMNNTQVASTAFVQTSLSDKADLNAPAFTGYPTAPTPPGGTNSDVIATTAFVKSQIATKANLASPTFSGAPSAPTAGTGTKSTQIATTAFVQNAFDNYRKAGCKATMSSAQSGVNIYLQCNSIALNVGSCFEVQSIDTWGYALKAKKDMYFMAHANFVYSASVAGRKKCGILRILSSGYSDLGYSYKDSAGGLISTDCTVYGNIVEGEYIVAYTQGASSDTVITGGTYLFINEL